MFARKLFDRIATRRQSPLGRKASKKARRSAFRDRLPRNMRVEALEHRHLLVVGAFEMAALVTPGNGFDGVVSVQSSSGVPGAPFNPFCTGSLLTTGRHILTAAHCVTNDDGDQDAFNAFIGFEMPDQNYFVPVDLTLPGALEIHGDWTGILSEGSDLAIITLPVIAPFPAERYDIYRGNDELGQVFTLVGYGTTGTGTSGSLDLQPPPTFNGSLGAKRIGYNRWDVDANDLLDFDINAAAAPPAGLALAYDFDNGDPAQDVFSLLGVDDRGLGESEAMQAPGDSGGPAFLRNRISGVVSYSRQRANPEEAPQPDIDGLGNNTFGEYAVMTRVSAFAGYIDGILTAPADVVLDMNFQPAGNNGVPDTITARRDPENANRLELLINGQEVWSDLLSRVDSLTLIGSGDDDTFIIDGDFDVDITVDGGLGYDSLEIIGTGAGTASYTPSATTTGDGTVVIGGDTITFSNLEPLTVSNVPTLTLVTPGSEDRVLVENTGTLGQIRVSGTSDGVVFESLTFFDVTTFTLDTGTNDSVSPDDIITLDAPLPASGLTTFNINAGDGTDRVVYNGTAWDDTFEVTATDAVTLANASGSRLTVSSMTGVEQLVLIGLDGDDIFHVPGNHPFGSIVIEGGNPSASDVLNFTGSGGDAVTIDLEARTVTENGSGPVAFSGVEIVNVEANHDLTVLGTPGDDQIRYTPTGAAAGTLVLAGLNAVFHVSAVGALSLDPLGGTDTVTVHGNSADNHITVDRDAPTTVQVDGLLAIELAATTEALVVMAGLGDDTITVTGTGGPALTVDGGPPTPGDTLAVQTINATVTFGGDLTSGVLETSGDDINFSGISTLELTGNTAGTLTVNGTHGDDAINQNGNTVTVNNSAVVNFADYDALNLNGGNGSDTFHVHPATLAGVSALNIDGGDPTASNVVIVNVVTAAVVSNLSVSGATVTDAGAATVNVAGAEHLILVGDGSTDLTVEGTAGDDTIVHSPGAAADAGAVRVDSLLPISYRNLGVGAMLTIDGLAGDDTLVVEGTAADDVFGVAATSGDVSLNSRVVISPDSIENLVLRGQDGDDVFRIAGNHPFDSIRIEGGNPSASDVLNFGGSGNPVEVALDAFPAGPELVTTITEAGFGPVILSGVEIANIDANEADVSVSGTRFDDVIHFTPLSEDSGTVTASRVHTVFHFTGVPAANGFAIDGGPTGLGGPGGGGFADKVIFHGTAGRDLIRVDAPNRFVELDILNMAFPPAAIATWRGVTLEDNIELVEVRGHDGRDTFHVVPGPAVGNGLFVKIDGGSPLASDALLITDLNGDNQPVPLAATDFVVVGKSRVPDAGHVLVFREAQRLPGISYENVEILWGNIDPVDRNTGEPNLLVVGPDRFEPNDFRANAAFLGSASTINVQNLAIFPNAHEHIGLPADRDYFRVVAQQTGTLDFQIYFRTFDPGLLPGGGQLTIDVLDVSGNPISGFRAIPGTGDARARIPVVAGQTYYLLVRGENEDVVNGYDLTILNAAPPVPYDIELQDLPVFPVDDANSDTGRSQFDNITRDNTPTIWFRLDDAIFLHDLPGNPAPGNPPAGVIPITFNDQQAADPTAPGYRVAVFVEGLPQQPGQLPQEPVGYARQVAEGVYEFSFETDALNAPFELAEGSHFISARVQMIDPASPLQTGFGARSASLEIIVDTVPPDVFFGMPGVDGDGLHPDSDSGVAGPNNQATLSDRVTNDTTPTFWGRAEANAIVRAHLDVNENGVVDDGDVFIGMAVAVPLDGSNQFPNGYWQLTSVVNMNDPATSNLVGGLVALPLDGLRRILVTAEDVAGNVSAPQALDIFLDTQGPQITAVSISDAPDFDLFDVKPSQGPTPLVRSLTIDVRDLPARVAPEFLYAALAAGTDGNPAENLGHYHLVGDHNGVIVIENVQFIPDPDPAEHGQPATGRIVLTFAAPLPDDRFTLTISDALVDPAGNALDSESNAVEPNGAPQFPSGDGQPGGPFVARFTVDTRAEIGVWAAGSVYVDTNGNFVHDPTGKDGDFTNHDITYMFGLASDNIFAGNFADPGTQADGFHKLAAYGRYEGTNRWLIDTDNNGVPNWKLPDSRSIDGLPVAGRFWDGVVRNNINIDPNSDQVGVKKGTTWYLDTNANLIIDAGDVVLAGNMPGMPIVGDFDGDGIDDLGSWTDDVFYLNLSTMLTGAPNPASYDPNINGIWDVKFDFGFTGVRERPFAADFDGDGFDDIGLWVPDRSGATPVELAEWYILTSGNEPLVNRIQNSKATGRPTIHFTPRPFGNDLYAQFGDNFALPVVGNFDPPVVPFSGNPAGPLTDTNPDNPLDVNADGVVTPLDALVVVNTINAVEQYIAQGAFKFNNGIYPDVSGDSWVTPLDALLLVNHLNRALPDGITGEGEPSDLTAMLGLVDQPLTVTALPAATGAWSPAATRSAESATRSAADPADGFVDPETGSAADVLFAEFGDELRSGGDDLEADSEDLLDDIASEVDRWWKSAV
jgi:hypothetical protein